MHWPDLADEMPAPRDDEPSSLRQDIADELADHLHSSFVRELHRTPEETSAKQHVLDRFGDPRRVARQLWFDAMKEKIMSQRVLIAALVVMALACVGSTGLTWMLVEQSRQASQALVDQLEQSRKANQEFLKESRAADAAVIEKLIALATPAGGRESASANSMEWNPVKIRLVKDEAGGPPAVGYEVSLSGNLLDAAKQNSITRKTDADGVADLGVVRPGQHSLIIGTPWHEHRQSGVTVLPGQSLTEDVVCPGADRAEVPVSFAIEWPEGLRDRGLCAVFLAVQSNRQIDGQTWSPASGARYRTLIVTAANELLSLPGDYGYESRRGPFDFMTEAPIDAPGLYLDWQLLNDAIRSVANGANSVTQLDPEQTIARPIRPFHFQYQMSRTQRADDLPAGHYTVRNILVGEKPTASTPAGWQKIDVLGGMLTNLNALGPWSQSSSDVRPPFENWPMDPRTGQVSESDNVAFDVLPHETNRIKVPITTKLADNVLKFVETFK